MGFTESVLKPIEGVDQNIVDPDRHDVAPPYKVRPIEEAFKRLIFDVKDV